MVRHEAGEALGAIADTRAEDALRTHAHDDAPEVAETCELALRRLAEVCRLVAEAAEGDVDADTAFSGATAYKSVDPAPAASPDAPADELLEALVDESGDLWGRYGALFALRNRGGDDAARAVAAALGARSALLRHEAAYSLGQLQSSAAQDRLKEVLADLSEHPMVRHEAAEALGAIASEEAEAALRAFVGDEDPIVAQSCEVALDVLDAERTGEDYIAALPEP